MCGAWCVCVWRGVICGEERVCVCVCMFGQVWSDSVSDSEARMMLCDCCGRWVHNACTGLSDEHIREHGTMRHGEDAGRRGRRGRLIDGSGRKGKEERKRGVWRSFSVRLDRSVWFWVGWVGGCVGLGGSGWIWVGLGGFGWVWVGPRVCLVCVFVSVGLWFQCGSVLFLCLVFFVQKKTRCFTLTARSAFCANKPIA